MTDLSFTALAPKYQHLWETCTLLPSRKSAADLTASRIAQNKARYQEVEKATTVPWCVVATIHAMEGGLNFNTHLHNGDPLSKRTTHVPARRPLHGNPPFTWEESAIDALTMRNLDKITDWTPARLCFELEGYNGTGYLKYHPTVNSPYLWSGTSAYVKGKYVSDGKFDPNAVSGQSGAVAILKCLMVRDTEVASLLEPKPSIEVASADPPDMPDLDSVILGPIPGTPSTAADLAGVSRKVDLLTRVRNWLGIGAVGGTTIGFADLQQGATTLHQVTPVLKENSLFIIAGMAIAGIVIASVLIAWVVEDKNSGRYQPSKSQGA